jgi:membrane fusion protein (multidrug efflux system)
MQTEVDVQNPALELVPGMYAYASVTTDEARQVLVAPVEAIDRTNEKTTALVVGRDGRIESRAVTVGLETPDRVEVQRGLRAGDLVIVGSRAQLKPGTLVTAKVIEATAAEGTR